MGMFDREPNLANEEWTSEPFDLMDGESLGVVKSADFGENRKARVTVVRPGEDELKTYSVYGVLADQISRMEDGDIPAKEKIEQEGRANVFIRVGDISAPF